MSEFFSLPRNRFAFVLAVYVFSGCSALVQDADEYVGAAHPGR